ncbi:dopamine D2-like receptor [Mytilus trossulus]|uniref:dopamine D2-like receptor n=1 Tax=Mytilus trossulus TaxID=6551 RepID=UPI00300785B5
MSWSQVNSSEISSTNSTINITNSEELLRTLNDKLALRYLPVIIYMFLLIFTGLFGNILVIIVYVRKRINSSLHYFIINLAVLDLLTVVIGMPTEIADLRYSIMFYAPAACKALRTVESLSTMGSIVTLMAVAIDRYNRICKYGKQMTTEKAKRICIIAIVIGIVTCWPAGIVFGKKTKDVGIPGISGVDCSTDDSMKENKRRKEIYQKFSTERKQRNQRLSQGKLLSRILKRAKLMTKTNKNINIKQAVFIKS